MRFVILPVWYELMAGIPVLSAADYRLPSPTAARALTIRPRTSDVDVFRQIFVEQEYCLLDDIGDVRAIIDCGANIGCSSSWFLTKFPAATVVAVEPDARNITQLRANLAPFGARAIIIEGAVWSRPAELIVVRGVFGDGREWATQVRERRANEAPELIGHSMAQLIDMFNGAPIDILKIDIEGAEHEVFGCEDLSWVRCVRNAVIEIHGTADTVLVNRAFPETDFTRCKSGELSGFRRACTP
jgi:FkbM family methyltransferase